MSREHETGVSVTVDLVVLTIRDGAVHVLLVERGNTPYRGALALPGGYLRVGEGPDAAALRELKEETGLDGASLHLEQLRAYGEPDRDPRGRVVTIAYLAFVPDLPEPVAGSDARRAVWTPARDMRAGTLAFDHARILADGIERARAGLEYTTVAAAFCREPFTISELREVYEIVWETRLDPSNFRRKVTRSPGFLTETGERRAADLGRPASLYRRGPASILNPPIFRGQDGR
ncbi:NUDIX domain-containing protein [Actinocorallia aurea]